jgi:hypothetical protein
VGRLLLLLLTKVIREELLTPCPCTQDTICLLCHPVVVASVGLLLLLLHAGLSPPPLLLAAIGGCGVDLLMTSSIAQATR